MNVLNNPILRLSKIHKYFPGVHALKGIDFEFERVSASHYLGKTVLVKVH